MPQEDKKALKLTQCSSVTAHLGAQVQISKTV